MSNELIRKRRLEFKGIIFYQGFKKLLGLPLSPHCEIRRIKGLSRESIGTFLTVLNKRLLSIILSKIQSGKLLSYALGQQRAEQRRRTTCFYAPWSASVTPLCKLRVTKQ